MPDGRKVKGWWLRLMVTAALVSQSIYVFGSGHKFFKGLTHTLLWIIALAVWSEYLNLPGRLKKWGFESGRALDGKLFPEDDGRVSRG
jgi:Na+/pantothenate symporter